MTANEPRRTGRIPADTFSNRLLLARKLAGMTIEQAAEASGVTKSSWANWENGRLPQGMIDICQAIASALDIDLQWLMLGGPLSPPAPPRRGSSKRPGADTVRYPLVVGGATTDLVAYPPVTDRPRDNRPAGYPTRSGRTSRETEQKPTHPGGSEHRRPRRLKYPNAA
jgi:transcriptional regulator with XRE-family HTH domain